MAGGHSPGLPPQALDCVVDPGGRLQARLEVSKAYLTKQKHLSDQLGCTAANQKADELCDRVSDVEERTLNAYRAALSDFAVKLKIYDYHKDNYGAQEMVADIRWLVENPAELVKIAAA
jgi:hypothetical protein